MTRFSSCIIAALLLTPLAAAEADFRSKHLAVGLLRSAPTFSVFSLDSLGQGKLNQNPVLPETNAVAGLELAGRTYQLHGSPVWRITCSEKVLTLRSDDAAGTEALPFTLAFSQKANHVTLLGRMKPGERQMSLPCLLHLPDMGTLRITCKARDAKLDYDERRFADGLTANDLIRRTLDRYLAGAKGYGQAGYGPEASGADVIGWKTPWTSLDSLPSFLISACNYVNGSGDLNWARANYAQLAAWCREMLAADQDGNGLIEYPGSGHFGDRPKTDRRPANWWDTINFGHEDAFANALAYRGATMFAELARKLNQPEDARFFSGQAAKLRAAYAPTLLNPATGVLAGWKSADGQLHDHWFTSEGLLVDNHHALLAVPDDVKAKEP